MQAIRTKYHGTTSSTGSRISAQCEAGRIYVPYNYALNTEKNHKAACDKLRVKLGWDGAYYSPMVGGSFGDAMYWVFTNA